MAVATQSPAMPPEIKIDTTNGGSRDLDLSKDGKSRQKGSAETNQPSSGLGFPAMLMRTRSGNNIPLVGGADAARRESLSPIDPLSQHINERIRPDTLNLAKAKSSPTIDHESPEREASQTLSPPVRSSTEPIRNDSFLSQNKDPKKNRTSFLGRFRLSKKETAEQVEDDDDDIYDGRPDGTDAEMFSQPIGYIPRFAEPPKYIKVKAQGKKTKDFDRVFLAQELKGLSGSELAQVGGRRINTVTKSRGEAIWALEFSKDGKYLASGGEEYIVRVWEMLSTEEDRREHEREEEANKTAGQMRLSAPVFKRKPIHEYEGHTGTILDLSWSKNNFLLSSSMDKTVRLWHPTRGECLCAFKHADHITSISFHPKDDRFFLAGSLDSKLRLWSIPDKSVAYWTKTNDLITAVAFTPDGKACIAGGLTGSVYFYETDGFRSLTQMQIRSSGRKNARGAKITSIQTMTYPPHQLNGDIKLLITSNDSRVRIYHYRDKTLQIKFKGTENTHSQIRASFSDDARYVICGSEDKKVYIWPMDFSEKDKDKRPLEYFEAHNSTVTAAVLAPTRSRQLLQASGDPIFDICNPPPVLLVSRSESQSSEIHSIISEEQKPPTPSKPKPEESPAYQARSCHKNGNIIVTADSRGKIKVFRQDCAYEKRVKVNENWDSGSTISKRVLKRTSSVATGHSRHSMQDSLSFPNTERVQSWRQSLDRFSLPSNSPRGSSEAFSKGSPLTATFARSRSPAKVVSNSRFKPTQRPSTTANTPNLPGSAVFTAGPSNGSLRQNSLLSPSELERRPSETSIQESLSRSSQEFIYPDGIDGSASIARKMFAAQAAHTLTREKTRDLSDPESAEQSARASIEMSNERRQDASGHLMPGTTALRPVSTTASVLTDEMSGPEEEDSEEIKCRRCGSEEFKARKKAKGNVLVCGKCGLELI